MASHHWIFRNITVIFAVLPNGRYCIKYLAQFKCRNKIRITRLGKIVNKNIQNSKISNMLEVTSSSSFRHPYALTMKYQSIHLVPHSSDHNPQTSLPYIRIHFIKTSNELNMKSAWSSPMVLILCDMLNAALRAWSLKNLYVFLSRSW